MPIERVGPEVVANTTAAGSQTVPKVVALDDGRHLVTWRSPTAAQGDDVYGRMFNADGSPDGSDFVLNSITANNQLASTVVARPGGGFLAMWCSFDAGDGSSSCIRARFLDADGDPEGVEFVANSTASASQTRPAITFLDDGRFVAAWQSFDTADGQPSCIRARLFNADGSPAGADFIVNTTTEGNQLTPVVVTLANGDFMISWLSEDLGDGDGSCVRARILTANGGATADDFIVNVTNAGGQTNPGLAVLSDGRIIAIYESDDGGDGSFGCVRARFLNADGAPAGQVDVIVNSTAASNQADPKIIALADGRALAVWYSGDTGDGSLFCVRARLFNVDGSLAGSDFIVNETTLGRQLNPAATALPDGRFVIAWQSEDPGDGDGTCIRKQVFNPLVFTGTTGADTWLGGNLVDQIAGASGADALSGLAGDDVLEGGAGDDTLNGGTGSDRMTGGTGDDLFYVNARSDVIVEDGGGGNADVVAASTSYALSKSAHVEVLRTTSNGGGAAIDLTGNAFAQEIVGNAGGNVLHDGGRGAADILKGLGGNDTYRVFNSDAVIVEGASQGAADKVVAAVDYRLGQGVHVETLTTNGSTGQSAIDLTGNEIDQSIFGNNGDNRLDGKGGGDTLRGFGGEDTFIFAASLDDGDVITDFSVRDDRFLLSDAIFSELTPGALAASAFRANETGRAEDASDRIIYEVDAGKIFYDPDGAGAAAGVLFVTVATGLNLTSEDFDIA